MLAIISTSCSPISRSYLLARIAEQVLKTKGLTPLFIDLRHYELPYCDDDKAYSHPHVQSLKTQLIPVKGLVITAPIYNWSVAASCKGFIELLGKKTPEYNGKAFYNKPIALMTTGSSRGSYMAVNGLITSLILDFRAHILPNLVHTWTEHFQGDTIVSPILERVEALVESLYQFTSVWPPHAGQETA